MKGIEFRLSNSVKSNSPSFSIPDTWNQDNPTCTSNRIIASSRQLSRSWLEQRPSERTDWGPWSSAWKHCSKTKSLHLEVTTFSVSFTSARASSRPWTRKWRISPQRQQQIFPSNDRRNLSRSHINPSHGTLGTRYTPNSFSQIMSLHLDLRIVLEGWLWRSWCQHVPYQYMIRSSWSP